MAKQSVAQLTASTALGAHPSLHMALEAEGYKVRTYNDGASALEALS